MCTHVQKIGQTTDLPRKAHVPTLGAMHDRNVTELLLQAETYLAAAHAHLAPSRRLLAVSLHEELELVRTIRLNVADQAPATGHHRVWAPLSAGEREHAIRLASGMTSAEIGRDLGIHATTARR